MSQTSEPGSRGMARHERGPAAGEPGSAGALVAAIRHDLQAIEGQIRQHPYLQALHQGRVARAALQAFPGHEYHIVRSDLRSLAALVHRFGQHPPTATFFNGVLQGEFAALDGIVRFGRTLGLSEADLQAYEVTPEGFTYPSFMAWQAAYGSAAAVACGLLVNFAAWGHNCREMSAALRRHYGFSDADTVFLDSFASLPSFEAEVLAIIEEGLAQRVAAAEIRRAARLYQAYEKQFWDVLAVLAQLQ